MLRNLEDITAHSEFGSKAFYLSALMREGLRVPKGFAVRRDYVGEIDDTAFSSWIVRSSADDEDQMQSSMAGFYKSYLDVKNLSQTLQRCFDENAIDSAIAQQMVASTFGGVCVTSPLNARYEVEIELCLGHNYKVTQGLEGVARLAFNEGQIIVIKDPLCLLQDIDTRLLIELSENAKRLEQSWGFAVDIEWCVRDGLIYYLQARPLTSTNSQSRLEQIKIETLNQLEDDVKAHKWGKWTDMSVGDVFRHPSQLFLDWLNEDIGENWSMRRVFRDLGLTPSAKLRGPLFVSICDRAFIHVGNYFDFLFPSTALRLRAVSSFVRAVQHVLRVFFVVPFRVRALMRSFYQRYDDDKLLELSNQARAFRQTNIDEMSLAELKSLADTIRTQMSEAVYAHVMCDVLAGVSHVMLRIALFFQLSARRRSLEADLITGLSGNFNTQTTLALEDVGAGRLTCGEFLEQFGHRGTPDWDISSKRWREEPDKVKIMAKAILKSGMSLRESFAKQVTLRKMAEAKVAKNPFVVRPLRHFQNYSPMRERTQSVVFHYVESLRRAVVAVGKQTRLHEEVFWLTKSEFESLCFDPALAESLKRTASARRKEAILSRRIYLPHTFDERDLSANLFAHTDSPKCDALLRGTAVSPGMVKGKARVVEELTEVLNFEASEIVVMKFADPAYASLLLSAGALVLEQGSVYSHTAIVAREFGLPTIVNVSNATQRIRNGQTIRVDGASGELWVEGDA